MYLETTPIIEQILEHKPALVSACCFVQMDVLEPLPNGKMQFRCRKCLVEGRKPMSARDYRKGVRRKIELLCDATHIQNLRKDTKYIAWLLDRWHEWLEPNMNNFKSQMRELKAHEDTLLYLNRVASSTSLTSQQLAEYRKTLRKHIQNL